MNKDVQKDIRNVTRGQCQSCNGCDGFLSVSDQIICDYCGCPPARHENLDLKKSKKSKKALKVKNEELEKDGTEKVMIELEFDDSMYKFHNDFFAEFERTGSIYYKVLIDFTHNMTKMNTTLVI